MVLPLLCKLASYSVIREETITPVFIGDELSSKVRGELNSDLCDSEVG